MAKNKPTDIEAQEESLPKVCKSCDKVYKSLEDFWNRTLPLLNGSYSNGPKDSVLIYRNCECGTTLTLRLYDRRDYSENGVMLREKFRVALKKWMDQGKSRAEAEKLVRQELDLF